MAQNKITATFGADVSEVEAKMMAATRATKYYENAVRQVNKADSAQSAGGFLGRIGSVAPKALGSVKALSGALGGAAAAAGLVPGLGMAAIGVAAVVAGVNKIRQYYADAAESAKNIAESMARAGSRQRSKFMEAGGDEEEKLRRITKSAYDLGTAWRGAIAARLGDEEILRRREAYDLEEIERQKQIAVVNKQRAESKKKADDENRRRQDEDFKLADAAEQRRKQRDKESADAEKESAQKKAEMAKEVSEIVDMIVDAQKDADKKEAERIEELAKLRYDAAWESATFEQRLAQVVKEGREAQAAAEKDASTENLIALEKARDKYRDLLAELKDINAAKAKGNDLERGERGERNKDGRFTRKSGRGIVSDEDRARADATRKRDAEFDASAKSKLVRNEKSGAGKGDGTKPMAESEKLLAKIEGYLKPDSTK